MLEVLKTHPALVAVVHWRDLCSSPRSLKSSPKSASAAAHCEWNEQRLLMIGMAHPWSENGVRGRSCSHK